jgi:hypothetical protein
MHRSKVEEIQGVQRSLSVNLNPWPHAVRSTRRHSGPVAQVRTKVATAIEELSQLHTPQLNCATFH